MAMNTPVPFCVLGGTSSAIAATAGNAKQLAADLTKQTLVLFDGIKPGGHPLAKEAIKVKAGTPNVKINGGTEGDLSGDITITMIPGSIPGSITLVENPEGQEPGQYLKFEYTDADGNPGAYYVNLTVLVDTFTPGDYVSITDGVVAVDRNKLVPAIVKAGGGLTYATGQLLINLDPNSSLKIVDGKLTVDLTSLIDTGPDSLLELTADGKVTLKGVVSTDSDNILSAGTDKLAYLPGDMGDL